MASAAAAEVAAERASSDDPAASFAYEVELNGLGPIGLEGRARSLSRLFSEKGQAPSSRAGLNRRIQTDMAMLRRLLHAEGYYGARIRREIGRRNGKVRIVLGVEPGKRFVFARPAIGFSGDIAAAAAAHALADLPIAPPAPARSEAILAAERLILGRLPQIGYPFARIARRDVVVDHETETVLVQMDIDAGPRIAFGSFAFEGLESIEPALLERMAPWRQGALY
ncbi:MAG: hypothetical protein D6782_02750, partial [Alphaproteobacteria bacterium]